MNEEHAEVQAVTKRNETFAEKIQTKIWSEQASGVNPYIADKTLIHGYNQLELISKKTYSEMVYLTLKGELPGKEQAALLDATFVALSNLGPRHAATRAVMNASVSKSDITHLLPIGTSVLSGSYLGAAEVYESVRFIRKNMNKNPDLVLANVLSQRALDAKLEAGELPGFGSRYGGVEIMPEKIAEQLSQFSAAGKGFEWCNAFMALAKEYDIGWHITGVAAAAFTDLGFSPKAAAGLFQIAASLGLLAHGIEMSNKPLTAMPFVAEENYHFTEEAND